MRPLKNNVAIAIDGGGIKGLIVAQALIALEKELGDLPLIQHPQVKILAGTSTGSLIAAGLALGMRASDIASLYKGLGQKVFPPFAPLWLPTQVEQADEIIRLLFQTSLFSNEKLISLLKSLVEQQTRNGGAQGNPDFTLGDLDQRLGPDKRLIMTTVNIDDRRTRFLKTNKASCNTWKLWEAVLASASAPVALPVVPHVDSQGKLAYYTDGGVGAYGNPAYVAAKEAVVFKGYSPAEVTVLSFGTGWVNGDNYQKSNGLPTGWHALNWAMNAPNLLIGDMARAQSVDILADFVPEGLDFRRFQFPLDKDITSDGYVPDPTYALMEQLGNKLGERILCDGYALSNIPDYDPAEYDPEGIGEQFGRYRASQGK